jgi:cell division septation protein DedD
MTTPKRYREPFRHARRHNIRGRLGRLPLVPAAAIGVAAVAALTASQAFSAATDVRTDQATVVNMSAARGQTALGVTASATPKAEAAKPPADKSSPATTNSNSPASTPAAKETAEPAPPAEKELSYTYAVQITGWYCGPAAARIALTTRDLYPSQDELANQLGTTVNGTNSSEDITRVLNAMTKTSFYHTTSIPAKGVTKQQVDQLQADVVRAISHGYAVVANIVGTGQDVNGNWYSYPGGHYITVVGYQDNGRQVKIADPANPYSASYWMTASNLADWVGSRGYAS